MSARRLLHLLLGHGAPRLVMSNEFCRGYLCSCGRHLWARPMAGEAARRAVALYDWQREWGSKP